MMQLYFSARSQSAGSGAISPSIEKTPSVMISLCPFQFAFSCRMRSQSATSLCLKTDRKSTRLNSSHQIISYAVFCLKKKKKWTHYNRKALAWAICIILTTRRQMGLLMQCYARPYPAAEAIHDQPH